MGAGGAVIKIFRRTEGRVEGVDLTGGVGKRNAMDLPDRPCGLGAQDAANYGRVVVAEPSPESVAVVGVRFRDFPAPSAAGIGGGFCSGWQPARRRQSAVAARAAIV